MIVIHFACVYMIKKKDHAFVVVQYVTMEYFIVFFPSLYKYCSTICSALGGGVVSYHTY